MKTIASIAHLIDHTLLKATATHSDIVALCEEALEYQFYSVCVHPIWVKEACSILAGSSVQVGTTVGFPLGCNLPEIKAKEAQKAVDDGAHDIDMVISIGKAKEHDWRYIRQEIEAVAETSAPACLKVILETCEFTPDEIRSLCLLAEEASADFVKTSTGFAKAGANVETIALMHSCVGGRLGIKASGGIKTYAAAKELIDAGATRIGSSASVALVQEELASLTKDSLSRP